MQALALPERETVRRAGSICDVVHSITHDRVVLVGHWCNPNGREPFMETQRYHGFLNVALKLLKGAMQQSIEASEACRSSAGERADGFTVRSAGVAEHLANAMHERHGIDPMESRDLTRLGNRTAARGYLDLLTPSIP